MFNIINREVAFFCYLIVLFFFLFSCNPLTSESSSSAKKKTKITGTMEIGGDAIVTIGGEKSFNFTLTVNPQEASKSEFELTIKNAPQGVTIKDFNRSDKTFKIAVADGTAAAAASKQYTFILKVKTNDKYEGSVEGKFSFEIKVKAVSPTLSGNLTISGASKITAGNEEEYTLNTAAVKPSTILVLALANNKQITLAFKDPQPGGHAIPKGMTIETSTANFGLSKFKIETAADTPPTASKTYTIVMTVKDYTGSAEGAIDIEVKGAGGGGAALSISSSAIDGSGILAQKYGYDNAADNQGNFPGTPGGSASFPPITIAGTANPAAVTRFLILQDEDTKNWGHGIWIVKNNATSLPEKVGRVIHANAITHADVSGESWVEEEIESYFAPTPPEPHSYKFVLFETKLNKATLKTELNKIKKTSAWSGTSGGTSAHADRIAKIKKLLGANLVSEAELPFVYARAKN